MRDTYRGEAFDTGPQQVINQYYHSLVGLPLTTYTAERNGRLVVSRTPPLKHAEEILPAEVDEKLAEVSESMRVIEYGGSTFEVGVANNDAPTNETMLHISTFRSSLTGNAGNAYELAAQAVRYPACRQLYVASFGNGGTSRLLTVKERRYAAKTGRFTWEDEGKTVALPSVQNLQNALGAAGLAVTKVGTDSAGGNYAMALGVAMPEGQLTHAFFSERTGFVSLSLPRIFGGMFIKENFANNKRNREISPDPEKVSDEKVMRALAALTLNEELPERQELTKAIIPVTEQTKNMWTSMQALRRGPNWRGKNPLVTETDAMLARQPDARVTFGIAERDELYKSPATAARTAKDFLSKVAVQQASVRVVMVPEMTHAYSTYFPSLYHAIKRYALDLS